MRSWAKINEIDTKPPFSPKRMNKRTHNKIINHYDFNLYDDWNVCTVCKVHAGAHEIKVWYHVFVTYEAHGRVSASERKHTKANQVWVKIPFNHFRKNRISPTRERMCVRLCLAWHLNQYALVVLLCSCPCLLYRSLTTFRRGNDCHAFECAAVCALAMALVWCPWLYIEEHRNHGLISTLPTLGLFLCMGYAFGVELCCFWIGFTRVWFQHFTLFASGFFSLSLAHLWNVSNRRTTWNPLFASRIAPVVNDGE